MKSFITFVLYIVIVPLIIVSSGTAKAQQPLQVEVKAKEVYLPGLPLVVSADIVNTSKETQKVPIPAIKRSNLGYVIKKEGATKNLRPSITRLYEGVPDQLVPLKPGEKISVLIDLGMNFVYDLSVGRYLCEVSYRGPDHKTIRSKPTLITIAEPVHKNAGEELFWSQAMMKFLVGKMYLADGGDDMAHTLFLSVANGYPRNPYTQISYYYVAVTEKKAAEKIRALEQYLEDPAPHLPDLQDINHIHRWLGKLYFESGDFTAAEQSFRKIPQPDAEVKDYLKKIEAASKLAP